MSAPANYLQQDFQGQQSPEKHYECSQMHPAHKECHNLLLVLYKGIFEVLSLS